MKKKRKNPCLSCGCWDSDAEGCTMPHSDKWYACSLYSELIENKEMVEAMARGFAKELFERIGEAIKDEE